jgi:hypothetical protein
MAVVEARENELNGTDSAAVNRFEHARDALAQAWGSFAIKTWFDRT